MNNLERELVGKIEMFADAILDIYANIEDRLCFESPQEIKEKAKSYFTEYVRLSKQLGEKHCRVITERYLRIMGYRNGKPHNEPAFSN